MDDKKNTDRVEKESSNFIDKEFDGIKELNNPPPPWLMWIFYFSILFAGFYLVHYHVVKEGALQDEEYLEEVAKAELKYNMDKEVVTKEVVALTDEENLEAGKALFVKHNCAACHGKNAEGNAVGPNLTDAYWLHGNKINNVNDIITNGFIEKGMTPFKGIMTPEEIVQISSYVLSLQGSNPPGAKEAQGEKM